MNRFVSIIISILFLSSCSGTGKNNLILSQELKSNDTQVFVKRETGFPGIAALIRVLLNGKEIGELGENERLSANTTEGEGSIAAHFTMIASIGANDYPVTFKIKKGEKLFFVIKQTLGLMSTTLYIEKVDQDVFFKN